MIGFCPLASGSKGNALYLGTENAKVLIDAGISLKELTKRLSQIQVGIEEIQAVLVTHEHIDHIRGITALCRKWDIPIFANRETAKAIVQACTFVPKFVLFSTGETFCFQDIRIHPFPVQHDAIEPVAFTFEVDSMGVKLGVCADLGFATTLVRHHLRDCDYLYVEANHQPSMVHACARPLSYKQRVLSRQGHLSNEESANLIAHIYSDRLKHIYLAHLSSECNTPELALETVQAVLAQKEGTTPVTVAWQDTVSQSVLFKSADCAFL